MRDQMPVGIDHLEGAKSTESQLLLITLENLKKKKMEKKKDTLS